MTISSSTRETGNHDLGYLQSLVRAAAGIFEFGIQIQESREVFEYSIGMQRGFERRRRAARPLEGLFTCGKTPQDKMARGSEQCLGPV